MTTEDIIIHIFCLVDEQLPPLAKHPQAKLYPSELVTVGQEYLHLHEARQERTKIIKDSRNAGQ